MTKTNHFATNINRCGFLKGTAAGLISAALPYPVWAQSGKGMIGDPRQRYDLSIDYMPMVLNGRKERIRATAINGTVPAPLVHWREGDEVVMNVTNRLMDSEHSSIHWHGILVPFRMDGVPGINFRGIPPGETYRYQFQVKQAGTYWYHSHSFFQEQTGMYGPIIIDPKDGERFSYDRDYTVMLTDWTSTEPRTVFRNLFMQDGYYNYQKRTLADLIKDYRAKGFSATTAERYAWGKMRMSPVDLAAITGAEYTYLMNGHAPTDNWTALFNPGETVRLRFINGGAQSTFDVRIPGLDMQVVMVDGKAVRPVDVHEFRISVAETYDVLVRPKKDQPFTIFAESLDRSGYARGTLSPELGLKAPVPQLRPRPVRTLEDIGMAGMLPGHEMKMDMDGMDSEKGPKPFKPGRSVNTAMHVKMPRYRYGEPGIGLGKDGWKVLTYKDLVSNEDQPYPAQVDREMTINITANMERFTFSFDGLKYSQHPGPYLFRHNERLRLWLVNHTMMEHPIHLHGMWMQIENGQSNERIPYKHTILVKPGEKISALITPIEKGDWAFHCHLLYHMEAGMFQVVRVA